MQENFCHFHLQEMTGKIEGLILVVKDDLALHFGMNLHLQDCLKGLRNFVWSGLEYRLANFVCDDWKAKTC